MSYAITSRKTHLELIFVYMLIFLLLLLHRQNIRSNLQKVLWICDSTRCLKCFWCCEKTGLLQHFAFHSRLVHLFMLQHKKKQLWQLESGFCESNLEFSLRLTFTRKQLETDPDILLQKAAMAMRKYGMHVVVANELATYKKEVSVVTGGEKTRVCSHGQDHDLEEELIDLLVARHSDHIKKSSGIDMN
ncbi:hypothetical protein B296_00011778 [Ensete ventricosum]|uniref:DNA/pantothenate metabolism flavoprotein C-terminal domain-containing protein n=1 Tax=Ensete ventricosum TaxID=4639 RepID=A0A427A2H0_ENSVE|nr:hypothetical protein B296_00011778 [Ensete ventricosum]